MGVTSFALADILISKGLESIDPTKSAFLLNGVPVLTFLLGAVFLDEKPSPQQWLGLIVAITGGLVFFGINIGPDDFYGIALTLIGVIAYTTSGLIGRSIARKRVVDYIILSAVPIGAGGITSSYQLPSQFLQERPGASCCG